MKRENPLVMTANLKADCTFCGYDNIYSVTEISDRLGWDISKWEEKFKDPENNLICYSCESEIEITFVTFTEDWESD